MATHIHVHTNDSGTSEGAKKAAQTRKAHGGGGGQLEHLKQVMKQRGHTITKVQPTDKGTHFEFHPPARSDYDLQQHLEKHIPGSTWSVSGKTMHHHNYGTEDSGTSEGARKAAQTRKAGGSAKPDPRQLQEAMERRNKRIRAWASAQKKRHEQRLKRQAAKAT